MAEVVLYSTVVESLNSSMTKQKSCSARTLLWLSSIFVVAVLTFYYLLPGYWGHQLLSHHQQVSLTTGVPVAPCQDRKILILYWTKYFGMTDFGYGMGREPFLDCHTNQTSDRGGCLTTTDRSLLNDSDAVVFHGRDLSPNDLPPSGWRRPHQHFIFFLYESPVNTGLGVLAHHLFNNYFNRTMTYRRDSDIVDLHPYGRMQCIDADTRSCTEFPRTAQEKPVEDHYNTNSVPVEIDLTLKNRTVAWFVTNCNTNSRRELLARNLSHFIAVDIYGGCGNKCSIANQCNETVTGQYRFYLSFENSLCLDYVTEKLYRPLQHNTIPVVYGGSDYSFYLPAGSYVNAMDFDSPEHLANYLNKLMVDDELYLSYFRWKSKYAVNKHPTDGICRLCQILSDPTTLEKSYPDIAEWWADNGNSSTPICQPPPSILVQ